MSDEKSEVNINIEKNNDELFKNYVRIYSNDSKLIPLLGSVFHNEKSRAMWLLLSSTNEEFNLKAMAVIIEGNENPKLPIYEYHIGNMVDAGIVLARFKLHNKHPTKFYRAAPVIMLTTPKHYEKAIKSKTLKNTFNKVFKFGVKFGAIAVAALSSHFFVEFFSSNALSSGSSNYTIPLVVTILGILLERTYSHFR